MMEEQSVEISSVAPTGPAQESAFANDVQSLASDDSASVESVNNRGGRRSIVKVALAGLGLAALAIGLGIGIGSSTNKAKGGANNVASSNAASADSSWGSGYECISEVKGGSGKSGKTKGCGGSGQEACSFTTFDTNGKSGKTKGGCGCDTVPEKDKPTCEKNCLANKVTTSAGKSGKSGGGRRLAADCKIPYDICELGALGGSGKSGKTKGGTDTITTGDVSASGAGKSGKTKTRRLASDDEWSGSMEEAWVDKVTTSAGKSGKSGGGSGGKEIIANTGTGSGKSGKSGGTSGISGGAPSPLCAGSYSWGSVPKPTPPPKIPPPPTQPPKIPPTPPPVAPLVTPPPVPELIPPFEIFTPSPTPMPTEGSTPTVSDEATAPPTKEGRGSV